MMLVEDFFIRSTQIYVDFFMTFYLKRFTKKNCPFKTSFIDKFVIYLVSIDGISNTSCTHSNVARIFDRNHEKKT